MNNVFRIMCVIVAVLVTASPALRETTAQQKPVPKLSGLWVARLRDGPDVRGPLLIKQTNRTWSAEIAGKVTVVKLAGEVVSFELPDRQNSFAGKFQAQRTKIVGHWRQPQTIEGGPYASPLILTKNSQGAWVGNVTPLDGVITLYLMIKSGDGGSTSAFLRNPERNLGLRQYPVSSVDLDGEIATPRAASKGAAPGRIVAPGKYNAGEETISIYLANRGASFDFRRVGNDEWSDFYPRGRSTSQYAYAPPTALEDGWPVASLDDVGISREGIEKFIQSIIDNQIDSVRAPEIHGVLIARHGKLVLEEYFHGENRDKPHDTRSAAKSLTSTLIGAAMNSGVQIRPSSLVYQVMNEGTLPADLDPRKRALTLENLMTMSSGLDCDDQDEKSPGREDYMVDESGATDFYKYTMDLKMIRQPGERAVYCSVNPNLAGGVLQRAARRSLPELMYELIAQPLQIKKYYLQLTPTGDAYMGGGVRFLPRDFMKLAQLYVNGGTWKGHRVLTEEWCKRATTPLYKFDPTSKGGYGYLWWVYDYPYKGRTVRAYYASGNGWQHAIGIPELDLVIGFYAGNYNDSLPLHTDYVPNWILPAVEEGK